jgi:hypothetical protein
MFLQKNIQSVYHKFPVPHRVHPSVAILGQEWKKAKEGGRSPDIHRVTMNAINKGCKATAVSYPDWPSIFWSDDLSNFVAEQPQANRWWVPDEVEEESDEGTPDPSCHPPIFTHMPFSSSPPLGADQKREGSCSPDSRRRRTCSNTWEEA